MARMDQVIQAQSLPSVRNDKTRAVTDEIGMLFQSFCRVTVAIHATRALFRRKTLTLSTDFFSIVLGS